MVSFSFLSPKEPLTIEKSFHFTTEFLNKYLTQFVNFNPIIKLNVKKKNHRSITKCKYLPQ